MDAWSRVGSLSRITPLPSASLDNDAWRFRAGIGLHDGTIGSPVRLSPGDLEKVPRGELFVALRLAALKMMQSRVQALRTFAFARQASWIVVQIGFDVDAHRALETYE